MSRRAASNSWGVMSFMASQHNLHSVLRDLPTGGLDAAALGRTFDQHRIGVVDVNVHAPRRDVSERYERAVGAVDRHVAHATSGFFAGAGADHLVVDEQRAVEQDDVAAP